MELKALWNIGYGMYVIGARSGDKLNAQIANTVFQITSEPVTVAVSINKKNLTHEYIEDSRAFSVSILSEETPLSFIGSMGFRSGRDANKLAGIESQIGVTRSPVILPYAVACLEVKVIQQMDVATHTIYVGEVVNAEVLNDQACLTYQYYQQVKRGTTPKTAPTFHAPAAAAAASQETPKQPAMPRYQCQVCGYIYDPEKGDPDGNIKPGTRFEDLPDGWICPVCGAAKDQFVKLAGA